MTTPAEVPFRSIGIVGFGLMGGSLARDLRALPDPPHVRALSQERRDIQEGIEAGILDWASQDSAGFFEGLDLVVYATPLGATLQLLTSHGPFLDPGTVVTDLVSLKNPVLEAIKDGGLAGRYVGSHPMAGGEGRGFSASRDGLYQDARVWLVADGAPKQAVSGVERFWCALGGRPAFIDAREHDETMAWVSHLPQLAGNALALALAEAGFSREDLGTGGKDMTRLAGSAPEMWSDILSAEPRGASGALAALEGAVAELRRRLESRGEEGVEDLMERTRIWFEEGKWS